MDHTMNPKPASPLHSVPSQSKTATAGERDKTDCSNSAGVYRAGAVWVVVKTAPVFIVRDAARNCTKTEPRPAYEVDSSLFLLLLVPGRR
jgi:hypothetical protein